VLLLETLTICCIEFRDADYDAWIYKFRRDFVVQILYDVQAACHQHRYSPLAISALQCVLDHGLMRDLGESIANMLWDCIESVVAYLRNLLDDTNIPWEPEPSLHCLFALMEVLKQHETLCSIPFPERVVQMLMTVLQEMERMLVNGPDEHVGKLCAEIRIDMEALQSGCVERQEMTIAFVKKLMRSFSYSMEDDLPSSNQQSKFPDWLDIHTTVLMYINDSPCLHNNNDSRRCS
jgi:hypothetical protein